jgi:hypothetical protein
MAQVRVPIIRRVLVRLRVRVREPHGLRVDLEDVAIGVVVIVGTVSARAVGARIALVVTVIPSARRRGPFALNPHCDGVRCKHVSAGWKQSSANAAATEASADGWRNSRSSGD